MNHKYKKILFGLFASGMAISIGIQSFNLININASAERYEDVKEMKVETSSETLEEDGEVAESMKETTDERPYIYKENNQKSFLDQNTDYVGWIQVGGTKIDYPIVRGNDNSYYLDRDFLRKSSKAGAIFMDYRNIGQFTDAHTVIYGHYMKDGSMFGDLHLYKSEAFYEENKYIDIQGLYEEKSYTIFSVTIETADDYEIDLKLSNDAYLKQIIENSIYDTGMIPDPGIKLLTLVTCSYEIDNGRILIHAFQNE